MTLLLSTIAVWVLINAIYFWWMAEGRYRRTNGVATHLDVVDWQPTFKRITPRRRT